MGKPDRRFSLRAEAQAKGDRKGEVRITSDITRYGWDPDDVTGNKFHKELEALGDVDEITVRINSPGGSVSEAVAIRAELMRHSAKKTIEIDGLCASAATLIACMPGAKVKIGRGSEYMIHRCIYGAWGHADDLLAAYNSMVLTDTNMADIYAERTGKAREDCLEMMEKETWMGAEDAVREGFCDEVSGAGDADIAACADAEAWELMREYYPRYEGKAPEAPEGGADSADGTVSNGSPAGGPSENTNEGVTDMEIREVTAERLNAENPELAKAIREEGAKAERERISRIERLTPKGARFAELAKKAKAEGTSVEDYLALVIEEQEKSGEEYLEARSRETAPATNVGGQDSRDNDRDAEADIEKAAKDIAEMAGGMASANTEMA